MTAARNTPEADLEPAVGTDAVAVAQESINERLQHVATEAMALVEAERTHRERLEFLTVVNDVLVAAKDEAEVLLGTVWAVVPRFSEWCAIYLFDRDDPNWISALEVAHVDPVVTARARARVLDSPPNREAAKSGELPSGIDGLSLASVVALPLVKRGRLLGVIQLGRADRPFSDDDVSLASATAGRLAASVEVRNLTQRELKVARALQASLLPDRLPVIAGLDMAVRYWPAGEGTEVGGDFYDVFHVADRTWGALIGDVCGTGPSAAALTGLARHSVRMSAWNGNDPAETIRWLNRAVHEAGTGSFLTAAYLGLVPRPDGLEVSAASGGHPNPIVVRGDGSVEEVPCSGTLLGPYDEVTLDPAGVHLQAGDTLVLYTDGVTDLPDPHGMSEAAFGEMLSAAAVGCEDAESMAEKLHSDIEEILPLGSRYDDIALLVIRVTGDQRRGR